MAKTCKELLEGIPCSIIGDPDETISGIAFKSDEVKPSDAFFCIVGSKVDGHSFAQDAIDRGAKLIVAERKVYLADSSDVSLAIVGDTRAAMALASCNFYDDPSASIELVGITGTNGKTTTTYIIEHILAHAGLKAGVIGTVENRMGDTVVPSALTTPESPDLQRMLAKMRDAGCDAVAMEVSSHALDLDRTLGCHFAVTAFTNLTQDHLDHHHSLEAYFEAKAKLFSKEYPAKRAICIKERWGRELDARCREAGDDVMTFGTPTSDVRCEAVSYEEGRTFADLVIGSERYGVSYPLIGLFNVENVECACAICAQLGIPSMQIAEALSDIPTIPGRMQAVNIDGGQDITVLVDFAHTPDALAKAIEAVRCMDVSGRLILVFGCEGGRGDASKRPLMGAAALSADHAILTDDDPHGERSESVFEDVLAGMEGKGASFEVIQDRGLAIATAIQNAEPGDCVLIAGRGHETTQKVAGGEIAFLDSDVAVSALESRMGSR